MPCKAIQGKTTKECGMERELKEILDEALNGKNYQVDGEEKPLVEIVEGAFDKADAAEKIQSANKDLTAQRESWKEQERELKKAIEDSKGEIERLQKGSLSDEDRKRLEEYKRSGMTPEVEAKYNTLSEQLQKMTEEQNNLQKTLEEKERKAREAELQGRSQSLKGELRDALSKVGINSSASVAINHILAEGMAKVENGDDGFKTVYTIKKDGKPYAAKSAAEIAEHFARENEQLVDSSGRSGTGENHESGGGKSVANLDKASRYDLQRSAREMMEVTE
jgi:hypothetical protein